MSSERRLLLAIVLALGVLVVWQFLFPPPPPPELPPVETEPVTALTPEDIPASEPAMPDTAPGGPVVQEEAVRTVTVETDQALVMFTNRGGRILSWKLTRYKDNDGRNLELVPESARAADILPLALILEDQSFQEQANSALYLLERRERNGQQEVEMSWSDGTGLKVRKTVRIGPGFEAGVSLEVTRAGQAVPATLTWGAGFGEKGVDNGGTFAYTGRVLLDDVPRPNRIAAGKLEAGQIVSTPTPRLWGGLEDTYFMAVFLPEPAGFFSAQGVSLQTAPGTGSENALVVGLEMKPELETTGLYIGPKDYQLLNGMGRNLQEAVHFQSGIWFLGPVVTLLTRGLFHALIFLHSKVVANWGWCIVILTVVIKLLFWPVTHKAMFSMKRMQEKTKRLQPKMAAIKERYRRQGKKDIESRQQMNAEIMGLYKKEGINPLGNLGGCLPLLLQLPILYGFYGLLQVAIELRQAPFILWIDDLSQMDPYYVLPLVMGASMVIQQVLTGAAIPDPMQRRMMYMTPVLFTIFFINLPAGLVLYWLVNNLLGILQQHMINRRYALEHAAVPPRRAAASRKA